MHFALPPNASCISGEGQIELQKVGIGSPRSFHRLIHMASQVVTGEAVVGLSAVAASR